MNDLLLFLTSKEIMIVYVLIGAIAALAIIVWLIERSFYKRKLRNNTKELNKLVSDVEEKLDEEIKNETIVNIVDDKAIVENKVEEIETIEIIQPEEKEKIVYEEIEDEEAYAREEIKKITESLIDDKKNETDVIALTKFEEEQEKNSIISIDELMQHSKEIYNSDIIKEYEDESNVLISLSELEKLKETTNQNKEVVPLTIVKDEDIKPNVENKVNKTYTFKSTPVISPIYGIEKNEEKIKENNIMSLENSATYDKFDEEIKKTNEFLNTLKELQKKLD